MSFAPVLATGGFAGWRFLERTLARQEAAHAAAPAAVRDEAYFRSNIGRVTGAADLVGDRRLLRVALTAFGLADDLPNRAFIRRVLDSDTTDPRSFAARLSDKRYLDLARAFDFRNPFGPRIGVPGMADAVLQRFREVRFEEAIGAQDESMRLALALQRDLRRLAAEPSSETAKWYTVLGTPSLRAVFETAFALPREFAALDLDRQVEILRSRTERLIGSRDLAPFADPARMDQLIRRYFVGTQLAESRQISPASAALSLLQAIPPIPRART